MSQYYRKVEGGSPMVATSFVTDDGTAVPDSNILNILGIEETSTRGDDNTVSIFSPRTAQFIVDPVADVGTHTTIQGATDDASSGDTILIRPGTYVEDWTPKNGVSYVAFGGQSVSNVIVQGEMTMTGAVTCYFSGIRFISNGSNILNITGSGVNQTSFFNCRFIYSDDDMLICDNANGSAAFKQCTLQCGANGLRLFNASSCGEINFSYCENFQGAFTPGTSTVASGLVRFRYCVLSQDIFSTTGSGSLFFDDCLDTNGFGTTFLTTSGTGTSRIDNGLIRSGSAAAISVGSGTTVQLRTPTIDSTNSNPITGGGNVLYDIIAFTGTGKTINTSSKTARSTVTGEISFDGGVNYLDYYEEGAWTPEIDGGTTSPTVTYSTNLGKYTRVGNLVTVKFIIAIATISGGSGVVLITNLPFTSSNDVINARNPIVTQGVDWTASYSGVFGSIGPNTSSITLVQQGDNVNNTILPISALANGDDIYGEITYWV